MGRSTDVKSQVKVWVKTSHFLARAAVDLQNNVLPTFWYFRVIGIDI